MSEDKQNEERYFRQRQAPENRPWDLLSENALRIQSALSGLADSEQDRAIAAQKEANRIVMKAARRQGNFVSMPFTTTADAIQLRPQESRTYFIIQNTSPALSLLIGFGAVPTAQNALVLTAGSSYEPFTIPTNEIYVLGSGVGALGLLIYAVDGEI